MDIPNLKDLILRPRATFEELVPNLNWKRGLGAWFLFSGLGLVLYLLFSRALKISYIPLNFGFGSGFVSVKTMAISFSYFFISFIILTVLCHFGAKIFNRGGSFHGTLGLFGYANILTPLKSCVNVVMMITHTYLVKQSAISLLMEGTIKSSGFVTLFYVEVIVTILFGLWFVWLQSAALSITHKIQRWKGIIIVLMLNALATFGMVWIVRLL